MNGRNLLVCLLCLTLVGAGVALLPRLMNGPQDPSPAELMALVDGLLDATDPCGAVIESDPDFRKRLRTPTVKDGKLTQAGLAQAWRQSIDLVEKGSLAPDVQARVDQRLARDEVMAGLQHVRERYRALSAGSGRFSAECRDVLAHFEVALTAGEALVDAALDPGERVAWAMDYSLAKVAMMNALEHVVDGVAALPGDQAEAERERYLEASAAFMVSPVMDYFVSRWEN